MAPAISVVGMACRYADARSPQELWENVLARRCGFRRLPEERLRLADYHSRDRDAGDSTYGTEAAVLEGYEFDRVRFRVAGPTYRVTDLTHWLALEVASEALADAGLAEGRDAPRAQTGVLVGNTLTGEFSRSNLMRLRWPYVRRVVAAELRQENWDTDRIGRFLQGLEESYKQPFPELNEDSLAGGLANTIAGRICNHFDFKGGGYTLDGACASSLLAASQACSALAAGDLDLALVGGVDLSIDPFELVGFSRAGALADGDMRVFDTRSAGFVPGEGCGFLVLMRRQDAVQSGRRIYADIRGWGISSDGHGGMTRPEVDGQILALERAYRRGEGSIAEVGYFEGHGTGTAVGDTTELSTLTRALLEAGAQGPVAVGSIKANIGHTKAAAGVAGLIKASLAVFHRVIPPNSGCDRPHSLLAPGPSVALRAVLEGEPWESEGPLRAGVSGMGFGGINAHLVLEGAARQKSDGLDRATTRLLRSPQDAELFVLGAGGSQELLGQVRALEGLAPRLSRAELVDLATTLAKQSGARPCRAALVASRPAELAASLSVLRGWLEAGQERATDLEAGVFLGRSGREPRCGFLFPGQGAPANWGGGLWSRRFPGRKGLLSLPAADGTGPLSTAIVGAGLVGMGLLEDLGIRAEVVVGHSLGELLALSWAGALSAESLLRVATARGQAMDELGAPGGMLSLRASQEAAEALIAGTEVVVAAVNGPREVVVSGDEESIEVVRLEARRAGYGGVRLPVPHAYHSPRVAPAARRLAEVLAGEELMAPRQGVFSTVTGGELAALGPPELRDHLVAQIDRPVRFHEAFAAADPEVDLWIEVGPGRVLEQVADRSGTGPVVALDVGSDSLAGLLRAVGVWFCLGGSPGLETLFADRFSRPFDPERELRFLANPCEAVPALSETPRERSEAGSEPFPEPFPEELPEAPVTDLEPLELVRALVAERAELPPESVAAGHRLLSDLHLSSLAVGQLVNDAARQLGLSPSVAATEYADATVAEVAEALQERIAVEPEEDPAEAAGSPAGVDTWVRGFEVEWVRAPLATAVAPGGSEPAQEGQWLVFSPREHELRDRLVTALEEELPAGGVLLCVPRERGDLAVELFLQTARAVRSKLDVANGPEETRLVVVQESGGGSAFAKTLFLEMPKVATTVVDLSLEIAEAPGDPAADRVVSELVSEVRRTVSFSEVRYGGDGVRRVPRLRPLEVQGAELEPPPLGPGDVLLVSGGGKGIGAECALDLARASGASLALLGRSDPSEDSQLAKNLERSKASGVRWRYERADVGDRSAVAAAVGRIEEALGPVTGILHAAGVNRPMLLSSLDHDSFAETLAPKVRGLENLLAAVVPENLRLLLSFGSIIARSGMQGEAHYAVANEWMTELTEAFARRFPHCRCHSLEWSVWAGLGMGDRLGRIEALARQGITPITVEQGLAALRDMLSGARATSLVVSGRLAEMPTLSWSRRALPLWRFLERPRVETPGVELVVDAELSTGTDPYLADHVFEGELLLPGVIGLEAMCQTAMALAGTTALPVLEQVRFERPVVVPEGAEITIRLAALVRSRSERGSTIEVVLRCGETGFHHDHFRARCRFESRPEAAAVSATRALRSLNGFLPLDPAVDLYGGRVLFQDGRFRRLRGYRRLRARDCVAEITPDGTTKWFGGFLPGELLLGDPAARDAVIHCIQASIPYATVLPVGVERLELGEIDPSRPWSVSARERYRQGTTLVYDVEVIGGDGKVHESWQGLELRVVEAAGSAVEWAVPLVGPLLERRLEELIPGGGVEVVFEASGSVERRSASDSVLHQLVGEGHSVFRRPDGKPVLAREAREVSVSHSDGLILAVAAPGAAGCDLEPVAPRGRDEWRRLLSRSRFELSRELAATGGEDFDTVGTRVWAASECLKKVGAGFEAPLVVGSPPAGEWIVLRSGSFVIPTVVTTLREREQPVVIAVLGREQASDRSQMEEL